MNQIFQHLCVHEIFVWFNVMQIKGFPDFTVWDNQDTPFLML